MHLFVRIKQFFGRRNGRAHATHKIACGVCGETIMVARPGAVRKPRCVSCRRVEYNAKRKQEREAQATE